MSDQAVAPAFLDELHWRGLLHQCTDEAALTAHIASGVRSAYAGFDPTSDSLTIGNLVPIMVLVHLARAGHTPVVVMGGGTGLIGDPSGKSAERALQTEERVRANIEAQRPIFERVFAHSGLKRPMIVNNLDWLASLRYIDVLREIGKHFSVNMMIQKESVRERLHNREQGISYTEFSYMILQAYDYLRLFEDRAVTIQFGGSDQWGNIVAGADLIRRVHARTAWGLTAPLVTKSDGGKFGKTESGAVWLTPERTSPYAFYQFWINTDDSDVVRFLKVFTLLPHDETESLQRSHAAEPHKREAHRALAREVTRLVHGDDGLAKAEAATSALFSGDVGSLDEATLHELFSAAPESTHSKSDLQCGIPLVDFLPRTTLAKSKREAREFISAGAVTINGRRAEPDSRLTTDDLLYGNAILLRRGKKQWHLTRWG